MKIRVVLASDEGKILTNGKEFHHMVHLDVEGSEVPDISAWREVDGSEAEAE